MIVRVNIAELAIRRDSGLLVIAGLGSCVGVVFYDPVNKIAGMTHIFLADSTLFKKSPPNLLKYADTALPLMMDKMIREGALRKELVAKIAGGSQVILPPRVGKAIEINIGEKNIQAVKKKLKELEIPLKGEDVGGDFSRTMRFHVDSGKTEIISIHKGYKKVL